MCAPGALLGQRPFRRPVPGSRPSVGKGETGCRRSSRRIPPLLRPLGAERCDDGAPCPATLAFILLVKHAHAPALFIKRLLFRVRESLALEKRYCAPGSSHVPFASLSASSCSNSALLFRISISFKRLTAYCSTLEASTQCVPLID